MGIFDIKNTDIFSKDYDSANAWLEYNIFNECTKDENCLLYTSPSPRDTR